MQSGKQTMNADVLSNVESDRGDRADPSVDTISSFIADWVQIKYFYSEAASLAQELCETLLASNAIRAIVTHRVKQGHRLEAKLRERVRKRGREYRSAREIRDDIVDLAGVRVALYFPSDREKIDKIIHDAFAEVKHKTFPEQDEKRASDSMSQVTETSLDFQQRFHGYSADHYRVRMRVENLATKKLRDDFQKTNPVIEIQVASVLMHAWAEIDHDLVYKTLTSGPASQQELRLLDATNGLVHTGEVLLQQLQTAMDDRVAYQKKPFSEQYELLSFLRGQLKKVKGSMEHLDVLLLVLKITTLDSPRRLGETLEGFMVPPKSADPIALTILEHILTTLGEEQRRDNNLYLRSRSVILGDLEIDKKNSKCYTTDVETRDKILKQRDILEMAVCVADILRFPEKSILVIEGMPQKFTKFFALYNLIQFAKIRPDKESKDEEKWLCEISLKELDPLWTWFETNDDVLFRVSLLLARMNVKDIDQELIKLRPSSGFQRQPSVFEPNQGYMSPRIPTPGAYSPRLFSQSPSRDDEDAESGVPRTRSTPVRSKKSKLAEKAESPQKEQNTTRKRTPLVSENRRKSNIQEEGEEEEEEPPAVLVVERTRRPYNVSVSQQESGKGPEVPTPTTRTGPTLGSSPFGSERRPYPGGGGNESTRSTPEGKGPVGPGRPYPGRGGSESTKSMPERRIPEETEKNSTDTRDRRRPKESMRTGQNAYVPEEFSSDEDSDEETRRPGPYRPPSPPPVTSRNYARFQGPTAPMPEAYPRTDDSYRPHAGVRERFGSFSERRESEPAFHPENPYNPRYSEPPPKPYRYPYPARRQYPFQNSSDSTGW